MSTATTHIEIEKKLLPELRFKEFEVEWKIESLAKMYANIVVGFVGTISNDYCDQEIGVQFVRTLNVKDGWFSNKKLQYVTEEFHKKNKKSQVKNGDILIARVGANMGMVCEITGLFGEANSANVIIIKSDSKRSSSFYSSYLASPGGQKQIQSKGAGGAQEVLNISVAKTILVPNPSLPEQQKIASFLSAVDEKIQQLTKKKALLEQYKKGVMQQLFSGQLRFKDEIGNDFPDWEEKRLGEVCECMDNLRLPLNNSERQSMQGVIPYWGANKVMDYVNDYLFDETIVLLAEDGGNFNEYRTRPIANISYGKCWVNNHTHVLKGKNQLSNEFLFYSLVHKNITRFVSGGTRAKLNKSEMLKIPIGYPTIEEQQKIATYLSRIDTKIESITHQITQTQTFKKGLLQQMFVAA